jgi:hypothetical protein
MGLLVGILLLESADLLILTLNAAHKLFNRAKEGVGILLLQYRPG